MNKIILPIFLFLFLLQFSFLPMLSPAGINFNLLLVFVVVLTEKFGFQQIFPWVFVAGLVFDYFSNQALGTGVITFLLISFFIDFIQKKLSINKKNIIFSIFFYIFIKIIFDILITFVDKIFIVLKMTEFSENHFKIISFNYSWEMIVFVIFCLILSKFFDKIKNLNSTNLKLEN